MDDDVILGRFRCLDRDHRIRTVRHRRTGHDADRVPLGHLHVDHVSGMLVTKNLPPWRAVLGDDRETIHRRCGKGRMILRRDQILGKHAPTGRRERYRFGGHSDHCAVHDRARLIGRAHAIEFLKGIGMERCGRFSHGYLGNGTWSGGKRVEGISFADENPAASYHDASTIPYRPSTFI